MSADYLSSSELRDLQEIKFEQVLPHFFSTPFYCNKLEESRINYGQISGLDNLPSLPFTRKEELRSFSPLERTPYSLDHLQSFFSSSGTSGKPTIYFWTRTDTTVLKEAGARAMQRIDVDASDIALILAPMGLPIMWYCMIQQFNAVDAGVLPLGVRPPQEIIDNIFQQQVSIISTLPVVATRLFEFMTSNQQEIPPDSRLRQFQCGGDFLSEQRRQRIEQLWHSDCYNLFGMSEIFGPLAAECQQKSGMHLLADYLYVEVVDPDTLHSVKPGEVGVAVYTTLWEKGSPLLRYWSDDFVLLDDSICACGRTSPRLHFMGRPVDMIQHNGKRIFAKDLEEELFSFPVGNEYKLIVLEGPKARLTVEEIPQAPVPKKALAHHVAAFLNMPVTVEVHSPGSLAREAPKPRRIVDLRENKTDA